MATQVTVITGEGSTTYSVSTGARGPAGPSSGATPAGTTGSVQINNAGALAADSGLVYTGTGNSGKLTVGGGRIYMDATTGAIQSNNIAIGGSAVGMPFAVVTSGNNNVSVGTGNLMAITTGERNVACGSYTMYSLTTGQANLGIGSNTLTELTTGSKNTALGWGSGYGLTTGNDNIFVNSNPINGTHNCQIVLGGTSDGALKTVIGFEGEFISTPTTSTRFVGNTLTWGGAYTNVNNRTSLVQTASGSAKTITFPNVTGKVTVYTDVPVAGQVLTATDDTGAATWEDASGGNLTSGPVTSTAGVSAIADGALTVAKTSGLQTTLDDKIDIINSQKYTLAKSSASVPIRFLVAGDSLSTNINLPTNMPVVGQFGSGTYVTSGSAVTSDGSEDWITGIVKSLKVGSTVQFHPDGGVDAAFNASRFSIAWISDATSGAGGFDVEMSSVQVSSGAWTKVGSTLLSYTSTTQGNYITLTVPSTSNNPLWKFRITNITTKNLRLVGWGYFQDSLQGAITIKGLANLTGRDVSAWANCPDAIFNPIITGLSPDLVFSRWADSYRAWGPTNPTPLTSSPTAPSSPAQDDVWLNTTTGIYSYYELTNWVPCGAWRTQYARMKALKFATDFVQISMGVVFGGTDSGASWPSYYSGQSTYRVGDIAVATSTITGLAGRYQCKLAHTQSATSKPGEGATYTTYWDNFVYDPSITTASELSCKRQSDAQRLWAADNNQTFIEAKPVFGKDYLTSFTYGMIGDFVHPTDVGWKGLNSYISQRLPVSHYDFFGSVSASGDIPLKPSAFSAATLELNKGLIVNGGATNSLTIMARDAGDNRSMAALIFQNASSLFFAPNKTNVLDVFQAGYSGIRPGGDTMRLGTESARWRANLCGISTGYTTKTANYTATVNDHLILCDATSASFVITPTYTTGVDAGRIVVIKKIDSSVNTVTFDPQGSDTVDGASTYVLITQWQVAQFQNNGAGQWFKIN